MLEISDTIVAFEAGDLMALERIITDRDEKEAIVFLKKSVYDRIVAYQHGKLKSHLETANTIEGFIQRTK